MEDALCVDVKLVSILDNHFGQNQVGSNFPISNINIWGQDKESYFFMSCKQCKSILHLQIVFKDKSILVEGN